jgi:Chemotaxis protein histidine kinase and related kinases
MIKQVSSSIDPVHAEKLLAGLDLLERNTRDLQEAVISVRMLPVDAVFRRFPRLVRDLSSRLGKQVTLRTLGEGTELDKGLIEKIADPLVHLVRNSIDHGLELPEQRQAAGKPAAGTLTLAASHQGGHIVIEVADDGRGLDREKILAKARERGLAVPDSPSDSQVWDLIFQPGFSTADAVTELSGRGVGMDVVRRNIQSLGGEVQIESHLGRGTRTLIRLPLTLAILDGMTVTASDQTLILPLAYVIEALQPQDADINTVAGDGRVCACVASTCRCCRCRPSTASSRPTTLPASRWWWWWKPTARSWRWKWMSWSASSRWWSRTSSTTTAASMAFPGPPSSVMAGSR